MRQVTYCLSRRVYDDHGLCEELVVIDESLPHAFFRLNRAIEALDREGSLQLGLALSASDPEDFYDRDDCPI